MVVLQKYENFEIYEVSKFAGLALKKVNEVIWLMLWIPTRTVPYSRVLNTRGGINNWGGGNIF